jgi:protoporphyrinogen oxidase
MALMNDAVVIGAGPSGLAAAHEIARHGGRATVVEKLDQVGGLSRTVIREGCRFDIGPHRFFTKNAEVQRLFAEVVANDLLHVPRLTRILFRDKLFNYPITPINALLGVGLKDSVSIPASYLGRRIARTLMPRVPQNFEDWVADQFGPKLFELFFKNYTEKVWGIPCTQIGAEWAAQRIKGLSLREAVWSSILKARRKNIRTLVDQFVYPRLGAGQFYEKMADGLSARGISILTGRKVVRYEREGFRIRSIVIRSEVETEETLEGGFFLSSAPLTELLETMDPPPPDAVMTAARELRFRHHIGVHFRVEGNPFPDNWIYVHSPQLKMARIANYRNFSSAMADRADVTPLTVEYFAFQGDDIWNRSDEEIIDFAVSELRKLKFAGAIRIVSAFVIRSHKAYPVIEMGCQERIRTIKAWLVQFDNLLPIGRCGMFKYNNQDHAIATGLLAARTMMGMGRYDPWLVNMDAEYHEAGSLTDVSEPETCLARPLGNPLAHDVGVR